MAHQAGSALGHYEILSPLGAGGMGEVWRARDIRLDREVAIKVLPESFAQDEDRLRRNGNDKLGLSHLWLRLSFIEPEMHQRMLRLFPKLQARPGERDARLSGHSI